MILNHTYEGGHPAYPQKKARYAANYQPLTAKPGLEKKADWHLRIGKERVSPSFPSIKEAVKHYVDHHFDSPKKVHTSTKDQIMLLHIIQTDSQ
jgi:hypothetical protein